MPTYEQSLVQHARAVARYQREIRDLHKRLKTARANLRLEQKHLRALAQRDREPDIAPMRLFGGAVGIKATEDK
jgi:hypothetical protein